jgi:hypothetical protein
MKNILWIILLLSPCLQANSLLNLSDDQFTRLLGKGIPDECVQYYLGDISDISSSIQDLKIIDNPGFAPRLASTDEQQNTLNELLTILEKRCYQDVKRTIVTNNYYPDMPKNLYTDDFSDKRVLDRYLKLVGLNK